MNVAELEGNRARKKKKNSPSLSSIDREDRKVNQSTTGAAKWVRLISPKS